MGPDRASTVASAGGNQGQRGSWGVVFQVLGAMSLGVAFLCLFEGITDGLDILKVSVHHQDDFLTWQLAQSGILAGAGILSLLLGVWGLRRSRWTWVWGLVVMLGVAAWIGVMLWGRVHFEGQVDEGALALASWMTKVRGSWLVLWVLLTVVLTGIGGRKATEGTNRSASGLFQAAGILALVVGAFGLLYFLEQGAGTWKLFSGLVDPAKVPKDQVSEKLLRVRAFYEGALWMQGWMLLLLALQAAYGVLSLTGRWFAGLVGNLVAILGAVWTVQLYRYVHYWKEGPYVPFTSTYTRTFKYLVAGFGTWFVVLFILANVSRWWRLRNGGRSMGSSGSGAALRSA